MVEMEVTGSCPLIEDSYEMDPTLEPPDAGAMQKSSQPFHDPFFDAYFKRNN